MSKISDSDWKRWSDEIRERPPVPEIPAPPAPPEIEPPRALLIDRILNFFRRNK
jgi:hypothetical protein